MAAVLSPNAHPACAAHVDFDAVYVGHVRYVAGVVHRLMGNDGEVDDVVQDTFVDALSGLGALHDRAAIRPWLVTVAVRRTRRVLARRRRRATFAFWIVDYAPAASDPRDRQPVDDLYDALGRISEDLRIPWILHRIESFNLPATAAACEVSLATVKRRIADAEQRLEQKLGPTWRTP